MDTRFVREPVRRDRQVNLRLTAEEESLLRREAKQRGVNVAELLRHALDALLARKKA